METILTESARAFGRVLLIICLTFASVRSPAVELVSSSAYGPSSTGGGDTFAVATTPGGDYVLLNSNARNLTTNAPGYPLAARVYVRDVAANATALVAPVYPLAADFFGLNISADGRYVLLQAAPFHGAQREVLLVDRQTSTTTIINRATGGAIPNGPTTEAVMTPNARYVAFVSGASNISSGDSNRIDDVFLRDTASGEISLVSRGAIPSLLLDASFAPLISPDGSKVLFSSTAVNIVPGVPSSNTRFTDLYLYDRSDRSVQWVSRDLRSLLMTHKGVGQGDAYAHCMSEDGRYVAYLASVRGAASALVLRFDATLGRTQVIHTNAAAGGLPFRETALLSCSPDGRFIAFVANLDVTNNSQAVLLWDSASSNLTLVSENLANKPETNVYYSAPLVSADGSRVVFMSDSRLLVTNAMEGRWHIFLRDLSARATRLLDAGSVGGSSGEPLERPLITTNAEIVHFNTLAPMASDDGNRAYDAFRTAADSSPPELLSKAHSSLLSLSALGSSSIGQHAIDAAGIRVAFTSTADDLASGDSNSKPDVFVGHLSSGGATLVSLNINGVSASGGSYDAAISPDGRFVAFASAGDDIVPGDSNFWTDVFLRDVESGTTRMVNVLTNGMAGAQGDSSRPAVSDGGRFVLFFSWARNLVPALAPSQFSGENLFLRDMDANVTYALTRSGCGPDVTYTPDFSRIGFQAQGRMLPLMAFQVWDRTSKSPILTNASLSGAAAVLSVNGLWYAGWSSNQSTLTAHTVDGTTNITIYTGGAASPRPLMLKFSPDARRLIFTAWSNTFSQGLLRPSTQLFLYDFPSATLRLISHTHTNALVAANGSSYDAAITPDGRYIAYASEASDLILSDSNEAADLFVYDSQTDVTTVIEPVTPGAAVVSHGNLIMAATRPVLVFERRGDTLLGNDFNNLTDVFTTLLPLGAFSLDITRGQQGELLLSWPASPGKRYTVQFKQSLEDPSWTALNRPVTMEATRASATDSPTASQRFYRVVAE